MEIKMEMKMKWNEIKLNNAKITLYSSTSNFNSRQNENNIAYT